MKNFKDIIKESLIYNDIKDLPFLEDIKRLGGKIYSVGGKVRDELLGKDSKDLDILISGVPEDKVMTILKRYGKPDEVGSSFGVIKFKPFGAAKEDEDVDIAFPRRDIPFYGYQIMFDKVNVFIPIGEQKFEKKFNFKETPEQKKKTDEVKFFLKTKGFTETLDNGGFLKKEDEVGIVNELISKYGKNKVFKKSGYKGFRPVIDHTLDIEDDLSRRDLTIGSIAKDEYGNIIDPFDGVEDIKKKKIKATSVKSFIDDPLRMLRAVQFASRFNFIIESETFKMIRENFELIKEITPDRILIEFDKIIKKGDPKYGAKLLEASNLYKGIFNSNFKGNLEDFNKVKNMSEFIYLLIKDITDKPSEYYDKVFDRYSTEVMKTIKAYDTYEKADKLSSKKLAIMEMYKLNPNSLETNLFNEEFNNLVNMFKTNKYPFKVTNLAINGNDLKSFGFKNEQVGKTFKIIIKEILNDRLNNNKEEIINYIKQELL